MSLNKSFRGIPGVTNAQDEDAGHEASDLAPAPGGNPSPPPQDAVVPQGAGLGGGGDGAAPATQEIEADAVEPPTDLISAAASIGEHFSSPSAVGAPSQVSFGDSTTTVVPSMAPSELLTLHGLDADGVDAGPPRPGRGIIVTFFLSAARTVRHALNLFRPSKQVDAKSGGSLPTLHKH